jgi:DNA-binding CsgD family transcriptional regulator
VSYSPYVFEDEEEFDELGDAEYALLESTFGPGGGYSIESMHCTDPLDAPYYPSAEEIATIERGCETMERYIDMLTPRQQDVIRLRMGFCMDGEHTLEEIADILGISHVMVIKHERAARTKLCKLMQACPTGREIIKDFEIENGLAV